MQPWRQGATSLKKSYELARSCYFQVLLQFPMVETSLSTTILARLWWKIYDTTSFQCWYTHRKIKVFRRNFLKNARKAKNQVINLPTQFDVISWSEATYRKEHILCVETNFPTKNKNTENWEKKSNEENT